jgi:hypothetical protein
MLRRVGGSFIVIAELEIIAASSSWKKSFSQP